MTVSNSIFFSNDHFYNQEMLSSKFILNRTNHTSQFSRLSAVSGDISTEKNLFYLPLNIANIMQDDK